jgi:hypothetical protein
MQLPTAPSQGRQSAHSTTHPEFVPMGIQFHQLFVVIGAAGLNLRFPGPEACGLPYLYEYKANSFV